MFEYWQFKVYRIKCRFKILNSLDLIKKIIWCDKVLKISDMYLLNVYAQATDFIPKRAILRGEKFFFRIA